MATASTFWLNNWISIPFNPSADSSISWNSNDGIISISDALKFYDEYSSIFDDSDIIGLYSGNGNVAYLGGSGISDNTVVPSNATITGLTLKINRKTTFAPDAQNRVIPPYSDAGNVGISITDSLVQLTFNGQLIGDNKKSDSLWSQTSLRTDVFGGENDDWGLGGIGLTPYLINNAGFGLSLLPFINWKGLSAGVIVDLGFFNGGQYIPFYYHAKGGLYQNGNTNFVQLTVHYTEAVNNDIYPTPIDSAQEFSNPEVPYTGLYISDYLISKNIAKKLIPDNDVICGMTVRVNKKGSDTTAGHTLKVYDETVQIYYNGALIGDNKAKTGDLWPDINTQGFQISQYGNSNDTWGISNLTGAIVNDLSFGVAIKVRFSYDDENDVDNIAVDYTEIEFCYQLPRDPQFIDPPGIDSDEDFGNPALIARNQLLYNQIYSPAYEMGYFDCLALSRDINIDPQYDLAYSSIDTDYLFTANNINLSYKQESNYGKRLAGEGANPNTFKVDPRPYDLSFNIPIRIESWGYMDNVFAAIYDFFMQGYKGSSTIYLGRVVSSDNNPIQNVSTIKVDNIVDFMNLTTPFTAYIRSDEDVEEGETVTVISVNKSTKILTLSSNITKSHTPNLTYIWARPTNPANNREPSFNLFSLREGLFSGCVVDSITLNMTPGQIINASVNLKFTNLDRKYQSNLFANFDSIVQKVNNRRPNYLINGAQVSIYNTNAVSEKFTLGDAKNSPLFRGFQEYLIRDFEVNEVSLEFKNNLQPVYSLNAKSNDYDKNFIKNLQPYAYYSNGRSITGSIKYSSPIKPWLFAEKLAGPASINKQGLVFNFGPFKLSLPEVVWSPNNSNASMEEAHQKSVEFSVATEKLSYDPYFEPTGSL